MKRLNVIIFFSLVVILSINMVSFAEVSVANIVSVSCGAKHTLVLYSDGSVKSYGINEYGQLGDGTSVDRTGPVQVKSINNVGMLAAGFMHSLALKKDGTVWAWGANDSGQLGSGGNAQQNIPVRVSGLANIKMIAAGYTHSLALKGDGTVWAWGGNFCGQLGNNSIVDTSVPVQVKGLSNIVSIAAGFNHSIAITGDGVVWIWGNNLFGELGNGKSGGSEYSFDADIDECSPIKVVGITEAKVASGGWQHTAILKNDGTVWGWGHNLQGQLGDGTVSPVSLPVQAYGLENIKSITSGSTYTLALKIDGTVWKFGEAYDIDNPNKDIVNLVPYVTGESANVISISANAENQATVTTNGKLQNNYIFSIVTASKVFAAIQIFFK